MRYESNMSSVMLNLASKLKKIKNTEPIVREIAVSLASSNAERIHNRSKDLSGANISYKPSRKGPKTGAYSTAYARKRQKAGRQISKVDLSFTGKMSKEFQAAPLGVGWGVGFISPGTGKLFGFLTDKYGNLWGISRQDEKAIDKIIERVINKELNK